LVTGERRAWWRDVAVVVLALAAVVVVALFVVAFSSFVWPGHNGP